MRKVVERRSLTREDRERHERVKKNGNPSKSERAEKQKALVRGSKKVNGPERTAQ